MRNLILAFIILCCTSTLAFAQQFDLSHFEKIPVLHEGRIKPMQSFALKNIENITGQRSNALNILTRIIFDPSTAIQMPIMKIKNPNLVNTLGLKKVDDGLYSYDILFRAISQKRDLILSTMQTPSTEWTPAQESLMKLQNRLALFKDLMGSVSLFLPIALTLPEELPEEFEGLREDQPLTYLDLIKYQSLIDKNLQSILQKKGEDIEQYEEHQKFILAMSYAIEKLTAEGLASNSFKVIPTHENDWAAPWQLILEGQGSPETSALFALWQELSRSYHENDIETWREISKSIYEKTWEGGAQDFSKTSLYAEQIYLKLQPYQISLAFYALSLALLFCYFYGHSKALEKGAFYSLLTGAFFHALGVILRVVILQRPPVSTLYESILFVGLITVIAGIFFYSRKKYPQWLGISACLGVLLHIVGFANAVQGPSLLMLSAVLNSNFWLATHVICISLGYAFCILCSGAAHFQMMAKAFGKRLDIFKDIYSLALLALLFSTVGTVLGGIWADQSWGRFWGWDPKENGALLIVLWLIWIIHGRISGQIQQTFILAGLSYLSVIVSISWFGVNLLNIGLHSYGFTQGLMLSLSSFIILETALISWLVWRLKKSYKNQ